MVSFATRVRRKLGSFTPSQRRHELVGPSYVWREKRAFQIEFLRAHDLHFTSTLVDIGCGTLRGGIPLIEYLDRENYVGVDVRTEVEEEAFKELRKNRLESKRPTLIFGNDPMDMDLGRTFDFAWAYAVLFHLTDEHLDGVLAFVKRHLKKGGVFYANADIGTEPPQEWREFPVIWRTDEQYAAAAATAGLSVENMGELHTFGYDSKGKHQHMLRFTHA